MPATTSRRVGARRMRDMPPTVFASLNQGEAESRTLVEGLAIDFATLLRAVCPEVPRAAVQVMKAAQKSGITERMALAGRILLQQLGAGGYFRLARHPSDAARGWAAYLIAESPAFTLGERLQLIRLLANDPNPGVREWAWLALRPHIAADIEHAIDLLEAWTVSESPFVRRFAVEATRPRGVWCRRIEKLVHQPRLGLAVIEPLRADPHRYVQDSVGNWLNDAARSQPAWVRGLCDRWLRESSTPATERICQRALRSL